MSHATPEVGAWEKHTKGIGLKLLQKFGFKGRLGANENGISSAVEVVVRPTNVGLGFGDTIEAVNLPANKKIEAEWKGLEFDESFASKDQRFNETKGWNKSVFRKESRKVFTAKDFIEKESEKDGKVDYIIDMRFSDTGIVTQLNSLNNNQELNRSQLKLGQELLYNINLIASVEESDVVRSSSALHSEERLIDNLNTDSNYSVTAQKSDNKRINNLEGLLLALQSLNMDSPDILVERLICLHVAFPEEFVIFGCIDMLPSMLAQTVIKVSKTWSPRTDHLYLIDLYRSCSQFITHFEGRDQPHLAGRVSAALARCVEEQFLSTVRRFVASEWDPLQDGQAGVCLKLFECLRLVLSERTFGDTLDMVVLPKLKDALLGAKLGADGSTFPHIWLLSWQSVLGPRLDALHAPLLQKLNAYLSSSAWQPRDTWIAVELRAWRPVLDKRVWTKIVVQCVVPKLVAAMRADFSVDPTAQDLSLFAAVLRFEGVIPRELLECLLLGEFFGQWLQVLARWVRLPSCDLLEIMHWCSGWRSQFPDVLMTPSAPHAVSLLIPFDIALDLVEASLDVRATGDRGQLTRFDDVLTRFSALTYESLVRTMTLERDIQRRVDHLTNSTSTATQPRDGREGASFKEVVEVLAEKAGTVFLPKPGKLVEGKQVWQFGKDLIYLEHNNVFASTTILGVTSWMPLALDDLLQRNKS